MKDSNKDVIVQRTGKQGVRVGIEKGTDKRVLILQVEECILNKSISEDVFFHLVDVKPEDFGFNS